MFRWKNNFRNANKKINKKWTQRMFHFIFLDLKRLFYIVRTWVFSQRLSRSCEVSATVIYENYNEGVTAVLVFQTTHHWHSNQAIKQSRRWTKIEHIRCFYHSFLTLWLAASESNANTNYTYMRACIMSCLRCRESLWGMSMVLVRRGNSLSGNEEILLDKSAIYWP